jgi:hypothetical protein
MKKKIRIDCSKAQYDRIVSCLDSYFEYDRCVLGKTHLTCPSFTGEPFLKCSTCIRRNVERVEIQPVDTEKILKKIFPYGIPKTKEDWNYSISARAVYEAIIAP